MDVRTKASSMTLSVMPSRIASTTGDGTRSQGGVCANHSCRSSRVVFVLKGFMSLIPVNRAYRRHVGKQFAPVAHPVPHHSSTYRIAATFEIIPSFVQLSQYTPGRRSVPCATRQQSPRGLAVGITSKQTSPARCNSASESLYGRDIRYVGRFTHARPHIQALEDRDAVR